MNNYSFLRNLTLGAMLSVFVLSSIPVLSYAEIFEAGFEKETVASGFVLPVAMAFTPDGRIFIAEKGGTVRVVKNGTVLAQPLISLTDVNTFGDRGLLGIAVDPDFASNGYVYLSYTFENSPGINVGGEKTGRIARVTVAGDIALESSKVVIVGTHGGSPSAPSCDDVVVTADCIPSDAISHSVGGLRFGPDGLLYATLGDGANFDYEDPRSLRAQNIDSLAGKVLRVDPDGSGPSDNPFYNGNPDDNRSKVFAYGVRNSFRLNFRPSTGALYSGDVGWSDREEINHVVAGANYGWPCWEGIVQTTHNCVSTNTTPVYHYAHNQFGAGSVTAGAFPSNGAYPAAYDSSIFIGDYAQNWIKRVVVDANENFVSVHDFMDDPDGPVDITTGPDGTVYFLSIYTGDLNRLTHTTGNRRPVVQIAADPTSGLTPLNVAFSSAGTVDPDGNPVSYAWNFADGATSTLANPTHTFTSNGTYNVSLTVTDSLGASAAKIITITVGNQSPQATIIAPSSGSLYTPGEVINLTGTGIDPEDGDLPASAFQWEIILHHNTHQHPIQQFSNTKSPWFIAADHDSADVYTEVVLTVTDAGGLTSTHSINMYFDNGSGIEGNLIQNPSVEIPADGASGNPLNWIRGNYGLNNPIFTYPVAGIDGEKALQVELTYHVDGNAKWYFNPISVTPGEEYRYSNKYTSDVTTSIFVQFALSNGTYQYADLGALAPSATPATVEHLITIPEGVETMTVFHEIYSVGTLITDDFSLVLIENTTDTTPPAITITSPIENDSLQGMVEIAVTAGDSGGLVGVTYYIDTVQVGIEDTEAPFTYSWDTIAALNGAHSITAVARDIAGNTATATPVIVTVSNSNARTNLILNGNLEIADGANPLGWTAGGWGNHSRVMSYPVVGPDGSSAVRTQITNYPAAPTGSGDAKWAFARVPVTPGTAYTYSDDYRSNTISDIIGQYTMSDGSFHYFGLAKEIQPTTTWAHISADFTPPAGATHVTLFHLISAVGYVEIDNVELYEVGAGSPSETNVPIVEFTNPLAGQTVSGIVEITASSTDDTAVTYIFYAVNGIPVTGQLTESPYAFAWDTTALPDGLYTLKATTHDPSGNNSTQEIAVTVDNSIPPPTEGNLILNPSVEELGTGGNPTGWFRGGWGTNDRIFTYPVAGTDGIDGIRVEITSFTNGDAKWYFAEVPVVGGHTYVVNYDVRSNVATEMLARVTLVGGGYQYMYLGTMPASPTWDNLGITIVVPENGTHVTLFHVLHSVGWLEMDDFRMFDTAAGSDTTPPSVSVGTITPATDPASGIISISANSADAVGVTAVMLLVDGISTQAATYSPTAGYSVSWNTASVSDGAHTIAFRASDAAGNVATSSSVAITVQNTGTSLVSLVLNASLETIGTNSDPEGWLRGGWGTNTRTFTYPVAGSHENSAARVSVSNYVNGDAKWYFAPVLVTGGEVYDLAYDYRSLGATEVLARFTRANGSHQYLFLAYIPAQAENNWRTFASTITAPSDATHLTIFHMLTGNGELDVDRFVLTGGTITPPPTDVLTSLIPNPSVEDAGTGSNPAQWTNARWGTNTTVFSYPVAGSHGDDATRIEMTSFVDGDAKWRHADVPVTPGGTYTLTHDYRSNVVTNITARYTRTDGTFLYISLGNQQASADWTTLTQTFVIPAGVQSVTIMHILNRVGWLETDAYALTTGNADQFDNGMITLTFDDGWISQYTNALPILDGASVKGTFYITSQETLNADPVELVHNPSLDVIDYADEGYPERWHPGGWGENDRVFSYPVAGENDASGARIDMTTYTTGDAKWWYEDVAVIPGQEYRFEGSYQSNTTSEVMLRITHADDSISHIWLEVLPSTEGEWARYSRDVELPADARLVSMFHMLASVGYLTIDNTSLTRVAPFLNPAQMLELQANGHEIGAHTRHHVDLTAISDAEAEFEISGSRSEILSAGVTAVDSIAYPFGAYDAHIQGATEASGMIAGRSVVRGYNTRATDEFALRIQSMNRTTTFAEVQGWINQAVIDKTWLILMFHQIDDDASVSLGVSPQFLSQTLEAITSADIEVVSVSEGVSRMNP